MKAVLEALAEGSVKKEAVNAWVSSLAPVRSTRFRNLAHCSEHSPPESIPSLDDAQVIPGQACERGSTAGPPLLEQEDAWSFVVFFLNLLRDDSAHILEGEDLSASSRQNDTAAVAATAAPPARPQVFDVGSTNDFPSLGAPAAATKPTVTSQKRRIKPTKLSDADRPAVGNITAVADSSSVVASATAAEAASNSSRSVFSYSNAVAAVHSPLPPPPALRAANTMAAVAARSGTRRTAESLMGGGVIGSTSTTGFGSAKLSVDTAGAFSAPKVASVQPRVLTVQCGAVLPAPTVTSDVSSLAPVLVSSAQQQSGSANDGEAKRTENDSDAACAHKRAELMAALASIYAHIILCKVRCPYDL
jgi:hypothetical protein